MAMAMAIQPPSWHAVVKLLALDGLDGLDGLASASSKSNVVTKKRSSSEICIPELDDINMYYICIYTI